MNKIIKITLIIGVLVSIILFFIYIEVNQTSIPVPDANRVPNYIQGNLPINVSIENDAIKIPDVAPAYQIELTPITQDIAQSIASNLEFTTEGTEQVGRINGRTYKWLDQERYFSISTKNAKIKYGLNFFPLNSIPGSFNEETLSNEALNFASENLLMDRNQMEVSSIEYFVLADDAESGFVKSNKNNAQFAQVNLTYSAVGEEIYTLIPDHKIIYIRFLPNLEVYQAEAILIDNIKSVGSNELKNVNDIKNTLDQARIINLTGAYITLQDIQASDIRNIDISTIKFGYFINDREFERVIQPIYFLEGKARVNNFNVENAQLYLPAYK